MNTLDKIRHITANTLCVELKNVKPESDFRDDFMADELDMIELFEDVERILQIDLSDIELDAVKTVQDLVTCVERALRGGDVSIASEHMEYFQVIGNVHDAPELLK